MNIVFDALKTQRLLLRTLKIEDSTAIYKLRSNMEVNKYLARKPMKTLKEADAFIKKINEGVKTNKWLYWAIAQKSKPVLIGTICLWQFTDHPFKAALGYELIPEFQGKGFMGEALEAVVNYGMEVIKLDVLEACTNKNNIGSVRLLEKKGFYRTDIEVEKDMILFRFNREL